MKKKKIKGYRYIYIYTKSSENPRAKKRCARVRFRNDCGRSSLRHRYTHVYTHNKVSLRFSPLARARKKQYIYRVR